MIKKSMMIDLMDNFRIGYLISIILGFCFLINIAWICLNKLED